MYVLMLLGDWQRVNPSTDGRVGGVSFEFPLFHCEVECMKYNDVHGSRLVGSVRGLSEREIQRLAAEIYGEDKPSFGEFQFGFA